MVNRDQLRSRVDAIVKPYISRRRNLSVAIGVIARGHRQVFGYGYGTGGETPAGDLLYEIGSVTKVFTASLLADLVREGRVNLDDPIGKFLPPSVKVPAYGGQEITLAQLATHTSGLPRLPKNLNLFKAGANPYAHYTVTHLYEFLSGYRLTRPLPAPFLYSNVGAGLLGHILALVLGVPYEEAIRQRICAPLGLKDTCIALDPDQKRRLVPGHSAGGRLVPNWDIPTLAGAGALRSTVHDLLTFLAANMGLVDTALIGSFSLCHVPRVRPMAQEEFGLGWAISSYGEGRLIWHNGATGGYNSYIGWIPENSVGVCVLTNHTVPLLAAIGLTKPQADAIALQVLKTLS